MGIERSKKVDEFSFKLQEEINFALEIGTVV